MARSGTLMEFDMSGTGRIKAEGSDEVITMHLKELVNGGEGHLVIGTRVCYDVTPYGHANNVSFPLTSYLGTIKAYSNGVGQIEPDDGDKDIIMTIEAIFRTLPERIVPGVRVSYTIRYDKSNPTCWKEVAENIRFPQITRSFGILTQWNKSKGFCRVEPDIGGNNFICFQPAVISGGLIGPNDMGRRVTYELRRVQSASRYSGSIRVTNVVLLPRLASIQEVHHAEPAAAGIVDEIWAQQIERRIAEEQRRVSITVIAEIDDSSSLMSEGLGSITSDTSVCSLISVGDGPKCFLTGTVFRSPSGVFVPVEQLVEGSRVVSYKDEDLEVTRACKHEAEWREIVELETKSATMAFTATHMVSTPDGLEQAGELAQGRLVLINGACTHATEHLVNVRRSNKLEAAYELAFSPDKPVIAFLMPSATILSMGVPGTSSSAQPSRRRTRRPGMNRRLQREENAQSIPDTEREFAA